MTSSYLERPVRSLEQALEDRAWGRGQSLEPGSGTPAGPAVDRHDPIGVRGRLRAKVLARARGRRAA